MLTRVLATLPVIWLLATAPPPALAETLEGRCVSVHDGDTMTVVTKAGRREKIRLLGIDAPEIKQPPWGFRSRDFTRGLALDKDVRVETDVQPRDKYGRLLGYVYVGQTFVNLEVIRNGHAVILTYPPNVAHVDAFLAAQKQAREKGLGLWDPKEPLNQTPYDFRHQNDAPGRRAATPLPGPSGMPGGHGASHAAATPQTPPASLAPDTPVRFNRRSKKIHPPGCGHECASCLPMTFAEAQQRGGVVCKHR